MQTVQLTDAPHHTATFDVVDGYLTVTVHTEGAKVCSAAWQWPPAIQ